MKTKKYFKTLRRLIKPRLRLVTRRVASRWSILIIVGVFASIGTLHYYLSAQSYGTSGEVEQSVSYTGTASRCNDTRASAGQAIKFGPSSSCDNRVYVGAGTKFRIYNPQLGTQAYYVNDHAIIRDAATSTWHIIGIQQKAPVTDPGGEIYFGHSVSNTLTGQNSFVRKPDAMVALRDGDEDFLWAPHIIRANDKYYMYYTTSRGGSNPDPIFRVKLATSTDLYNWTRVGTMFKDGWNARDPYVIRIGNQWVMYYCATKTPNISDTPIVAYRTSTDLINWSDRKTAVTVNQHLVYTESPQVVQRNGIWYMIVANSYGGTPYNTTTVYQSLDPFNFKTTPYAQYNAHAGEIVQDTDGKWYTTHAGHQAGGVWLAPMIW